MSPLLPTSFTDLETASKRPHVDINVMGMVADYMAPTPTRGTDWMCSFSLVDASYGGLDEDGLKIRFFKSTQSEMPAITGIGDVCLLRGIRMKEWNGMTIGLSSRATSWTVFPATSLPLEAPVCQLKPDFVKEPRAPAPCYSEILHAIGLASLRARKTHDALACASSNQVNTHIAAGLSSGNPPANPMRREKFSLIKDAQLETYNDLVAQVIKVYPQNDRVELYVSDYTSNSLLFNYEWGQDELDGNGPGREGDEFDYVPRNYAQKKWNGPPGKLTLTVTLWPPHSYFGRDCLKDNDFVHLRNVRIKWSQDKKMEGVLHSDRKYPDRIDVTILKNNEDDDRVKDVLRRKRDHARKFQKQNASMIARARAQMRTGSQRDVTLSKDQLQRKRKRLDQEYPAFTNDQTIGNIDVKDNGVKHRSHTRKEKLPNLPPQKEILNPNGELSLYFLVSRTKVVEYYW